MAGCTFSPHTCVTPVGIYWSSSSNPPPLPLHYVQGKRGGLRCYVPPGPQATQNRSLPNDALDVSPCRIALHSSRSGGDSLSREPEGEVRHVRRSDVWIWEGIFGNPGHPFYGWGCVFSGRDQEIYFCRAMGSRPVYENRNSHSECDGPICRNRGDCLRAARASRTAHAPRCDSVARRN